MGAPAIRVEGLSKRYMIGAPSPRGGHLRELVTDALATPFRRLRGAGAPKETGREFWALRDVSFDVPRGEVLGIIGANGVGKSTLLKSISRVTAPTAGRAELWGRVGSLLEVGTGFHPDLTGRENIYLNGTILGMRKREIDRKFDEIVAFAGVGPFIGHIVAKGDPRSVAAAYMGSQRGASFRAQSRTGRVQLLAAEVRNAAPEPLVHPVCTESLSIRLRYVLPEASPGLRVGIEVLAPDGTPLFTSNVLDSDVEAPSAAGEYEARVVVPANTLLTGEFHLSVRLWNEGEIFDVHEPALTFTVHPGPSPLHLHRLGRRGFIQVPCRWEIEACRLADGAPVPG